MVDYPDASDESLRNEVVRVQAALSAAGPLLSLPEKEREAAAFTLMSRPQTRASHDEASLLALCADSAPRVRRGAVLLLVSFVQLSAQATSTLQALAFDDCDEVVRGLAWYGLMLGSPANMCDSVRQVLRLLGCEVGQVGSLLAEAIEDAEKQQALLQEKIACTQEVLSANELQCWKQFGGAATTAMLENSAKAVENLKNSEPLVRAAAVAIIRSYWKSAEKHVDTWIEMARSEDHAIVRQELMWSIADVAESTASKSLCPLLASVVLDPAEDDDVRAVAYMGLLRVAGPRVLSELGATNDVDWQFPSQVDWEFVRLWANSPS